MKVDRQTSWVNDLEEPDVDIGADEGDPVDFWVQKQRELVSSVVDYNLATLASLVQERDIDMSPTYQRRFRWDDVRQSRLIESFLMNDPIPPIFLNEYDYGQYSVIDGKQRLNAISSFLRGRLRLKGLKIFSELNGLTYDDLPKVLQTVINTRPTLRAVIILRQSDEDVKFEVFQILNTVVVTLNPQEIRNSTFTGPLNDLIVDLSTSKEFHRLLGIKNPQRSLIYREMRDAEFVLRYLTFRDNWQTFSGGMKRHMDGYMSENRDMPAAALQTTRTDFLRTLEIVEAGFGEYAFNRWDPNRNQWRRQVLASLFDAEMFASREFSAEQLAAKQPEILLGVQDLMSNPDFRKSIDAATNTPSFFKDRIEMMKDMLVSIVGSGE
jgi:hypothetical protein